MSLVRTHDYISWLHAYDFQVIAEAGFGDYDASALWCVKQSGYGFNIINKVGDNNYLNYHDEEMTGGAHLAITTYAQKDDVWTFEPKYYTVSIDYFNLVVELVGNISSSDTVSITSFPSNNRAQSSEMQLNNCNGETVKHHLSTMSGDVPSSITIMFNEHIPNRGKAVEDIFRHISFGVSTKIIEVRGTKYLMEHLNMGKHP
jgi:hypothetical protein